MDNIMFFFLTLNVAIVAFVVCYLFHLYADFKKHDKILNKIFEKDKKIKSDKEDRLCSDFPMHFIYEKTETTYNENDQSQNKNL